LIIVSVAAFACLDVAPPAWAKKHHPRPQASDSDPCAAPRAYVSDHIDRIKALEAAAPKGNSSLFNIFGDGSEARNKRSAEISELRYDADGVNALLRAGGCKAFDLDRELAPAAK
jgi:hypothetical protein